MKTNKRIVLLVLMSLFLIQGFTQNNLFYDSFDNNLSQWTLYGNPSPKWLSGLFGEYGLFDNNGDPNYNSGAVSKQSVDLSKGFVLESEIYLDFSNISGCWNSADIGIADQKYQDWGGYNPIITIGLAASGDACWAEKENFRRHSYLSAGYNSVKGWISLGDHLNADSYNNGWHILKIIVDHTLIPKFYVDENIVFTGVEQVDNAIISTSGKIWLGSRSSGSAGKSYHNWVKLSDAGGDETEAAYEDNQVNETENDVYSPSGSWLKKEEFINSPGIIDLYVPSIISTAHSKLLDNSPLGNQILLYSRRSLYKDLFMELMLMTTSNDHQFEYEMSKPINAIIFSENYAIKMLAEIKIINKSSLLFKEFPSQLKIVGLIFSIDDKVNEAGVEAASIYVCLNAFQDFRFKLIQSQISNQKPVDPDMINGLNDAYNELVKMKTKDIATLKEQLEMKHGTEELTSGITKMVLGSQFGTIVSALAGGGMLGVSLGTVLPTAWFWQLNRSYKAEKAEASIVLLSSIDRLIFENINIGPSYSDKYEFMKMRSHLSFMIFQAANNFNKSSSVQYNFKQPLRSWISGFPYYDYIELAFAKQKAIGEIDFRLSKNNSVNTAPTFDQSTGIPMTTGGQSANLSQSSNNQSSNLTSSDLSKNPVDYAKEIISKSYGFWNIMGYSSTLAVYTIGKEVAMYGGGYLLLESPNLAFEMATSGFYGVSGKIGTDILLNIIESSVQTPKKLCKSISRSAIDEGLKDYKISYAIASKYIKTKSLTREEAISFLKHRWGLNKLALARKLYNDSNGPEETTKESLSKTVLTELNNNLGNKLQKEVGLKNTIAIGDAAYFIIELFEILNSNKIGLSQYKPYLDFTKNIENLNKIILSEKKQFNM